MAHELFGERFYGKQRTPAWHGLGKVIDIPMTAEAAFDLMGAYDIHAEKVYLHDGGTVPAQAIVRDATSDAVAKVIGVVGPDFMPVGPRTTCQVFDSKVARPVETIGALRDGETLFVSTKLPSIDVRGDEVEMYILLVNPMGGGEAIQIRTTPVRVVCMNTLNMAQSMSTQLYKVRHDINALSNMGGWLGGVMEKAAGQVAMMKEALEILADFRVTDAVAGEVLLRTYPEPRDPRNTAPREVMIKREEHRAYIAQRRAVTRETVMSLYHGAGTGMNMPQTAGTAYGLFNAVAEYEDNAWSKNTKAALESAVFGDRADSKIVCFDNLLELAKAR
jgi:phage/plasmid-like protein (TIGR03299 family)